MLQVYTIWIPTISASVSLSLSTDSCTPSINISSLLFTCQSLFFRSTLLPLFIQSQLYASPFPSHPTYLYDVDALSRSVPFGGGADSCGSLFRSTCPLYINLRMALLNKLSAEKLSVALNLVPQQNLGRFCNLPPTTSG